MTVELHQGDCLDVMRAMEAGSVDSIVCDPPYGLEFMSVGWDTFKDRSKGRSRTRNEWGDFGSREHPRKPQEQARIARKKAIAFQDFSALWAVEALRVAKPGAHLLAFGGTRTFHRLAVAIEDAGWEIRDTVMWVYGSGFPKSMDVSKAIDKAAGAERERIAGPKSGGMAALNKGNAEHGYRESGYYKDGNMMLSSVAATEAAKQWQGYGTALKPAWEPIIVARKPLDGTVAANVLKHGTGVLNIDGCRVEHVTVADGSLALNPHLRKTINGGNGGNIIAHEEERRVVTPDPQGRFPANLIHDGSDEVLACFPKQKSGANPSRRGSPKFRNAYGEFEGQEHCKVARGAESGSAARFFYCAKASRSDRDEGNTHPTVKPTALMAYLCRLVTPPGGTVLDPFMGSGSTGKAAMLEGFRFIGIEREAEYIEIARARIEAARQQPDLFAASAA